MKNFPDLRPIPYPGPGSQRSAPNFPQVDLPLTGWALPGGIPTDYPPERQDLYGFFVDEARVP